MSTTEDQIKKMYSSQLASQKEQLQQDYLRADAEYAAEKEKAQKATDANLTRTAVEAQKAAVSNAELHDAYGLSSGARAQARLAQENQLQSNLTALRMQQQELDADVERQRSLLSQQYQSAIRQAQAENDLAKAEALYKEAKTQQANLLAQQQTQNQYALEAAKLMAEAGDYTRLAGIYGLSDAELKALMGETVVPDDTVPNVPQVTLSDYGDAVRQYVAGVNGHDSFTNQNNTVTPAIGDNAGNPSSYENLVVDEESIRALGLRFDQVDADTLNRLVEQGLIVEYIEDGKIKFRRSTNWGGLPFSTGVMPHG